MLWLIVGHLLRSPDEGFAGPSGFQGSAHGFEGADESSQNDHLAQPVRSTRTHPTRVSASQISVNKGFSDHLRPASCPLMFPMVLFQSRRQGSVSVRIGLCMLVPMSNDDYFRPAEAERADPERGGGSGGPRYWRRAAPCRPQPGRSSRRSRRMHLFCNRRPRRAAGHAAAAEGEATTSCGRRARQTPRQVEAAGAAGPGCRWRRSGRSSLIRRHNSSSSTSGAAGTARTRRAGAPPRTPLPRSTSEVRLRCCLVGFFVCDEGACSRCEQHAGSALCARSSREGSLGKNWPWCGNDPKQSVPDIIWTPRDLKLQRSPRPRVRSVEGELA